MKGLINKIESIENLCQIGGCLEDDIFQAQNKLNLLFSPEYKLYMLKYGAISFKGTEWTGLGKHLHGYLNVVNITLTMRELDIDFPLDCYVIENLGIDKGMVISNFYGKVYLYNMGEKYNLYDNLEEYLAECMLR
ncbi:SMI1/KNR4 family protein [Selenomonas ruminantium]|uniref:SMI1-KNR4 cell-wall n=1 Tax=Selenomonas ruminantium TaxID=971 RepID=A0A1H0NGC5_SELRU|nr:SMI1/KNR4 family protein [Selenomonas ruminantium]SDO91370.1 SMI1-KNR4 cell-wall [Selenomonas ruminantium]